MSETLDAFRREYFDSSSRLRVSRPNAEVLLRLSHDDRAKAEAMLIHALHTTSINAFDALGFLKSQRAIPSLKNLLRKATGLSRVHVARALWDVCKYDESIDILCSVASRPGFFNRDARKRAIASLSDIDDDRVVSCLAGLLESKNFEELTLNTLARLLGANDALERCNLAMAKGREAFLIADEHLRDEVHRLLQERRKVTV